jgi:hypothetical protein
MYSGPVPNLRSQSRNDFATNSGPLSDVPGPPPQALRPTALDDLLASHFPFHADRQAFPRVLIDQG